MHLLNLSRGPDDDTALDPRAVLETAFPHAPQLFIEMAYYSVQAVDIALQIAQRTATALMPRSTRITLGMMGILAEAKNTPPDQRGLPAQELKYAQAKEALQKAMAEPQRQLNALKSNSLAPILTKKIQAYRLLLANIEAIESPLVSDDMHAEKFAAVCKGIYEDAAMQLDGLYNMLMDLAFSEYAGKHNSIAFQKVPLAQNLSTASIITLGKLLQLCQQEDQAAEDFLASVRPFVPEDAIQTAESILGRFRPANAEIKAACQRYIRQRESQLYTALMDLWKRTAPNRANFWELARQYLQGVGSQFHPDEVQMMGEVVIALPFPPPGLQ